MSRPSVAPALPGASVPEPANAHAAYDADVCTWAFEQAALVRAGRFSELDIANIAEELETLGRTEFSKLESALSVLIQHMLKWDFQPERRSRSRALTIDEQRDRVADCLKDNPGLTPRRLEAVERGFRYGRRAAIRETRLPPNTFPSECPYDWDTLMQRAFEADT